MTRPDATGITLAKSTLIRLSDSAREVSCEAGRLWITLDQDRRDILLEPGQRFRRETATGIVVYALTPSRMTVRHTRPAPSPVRRKRWSLTRSAVNG